MYTNEIKFKLKPNQPRPRFDLEKFKDPGVAYTFQATVYGKFTPLIGYRLQYQDNHLQ